MGWLRHKGVEIVLVWAVIAIALAITALRGGDVPFVAGDDAMRLVQAMDLLNGQSWFDTTQYRDNAPFGAPMHWSRLVDAPLVLLIALLTPFAHEAAPYWAAFVWPLLVLLATVALLAELTERLAGPAARLPALGLLAMAIAIYTEFMPGRVDHHNVQIALTLALILASLLGRCSTLWALAAGIIAATALAIGTEVLPSVVAALICFALYWLVEPQRSRPAVLAFAAAFPAGLLIHLLASGPVEAWLAPACDALSATYVVAGASYGLVMLAAVLAGPFLRHPLARLGLLAGLGLLTLVVVLWLFPECRNGPYGNLDADLATILLSEIGEAQPIWIWGSQMRAQIALLIMPVLGMAAVLLVTVLAPAGQRWRWLVLAGFCLALFLVFCLQVRGFRLLTIAVLPGPAWLVWRVWSWFRTRQTLVAAAQAGLTVLAFMSAAHWTLFTYAYAMLAPEPPSPEGISWHACLERSAYEPLAALPPGRLMSFLLIGPTLLLETPHSIVSAGYHRNEAGLRDMVRFYAGGEAEARAVARERGLDYLVFCRGLPPSQALHGLPDFSGLSWSWLVPVSPPDATLQIYAIDLSR
ncbi:hypothetical protein ACLI1C_01155 [Devosia sp. XGJD_8]|uniref:hypothetical protein n=1 Tax=Devosia sp. XGJD_8 TaxID=3391187 RepID=UPI003984A624